MNDQPTYDELQAAWTEAIHAHGIPGANAEAMQRLISLRNKKTTWLGKQENDLRYALDAYISERS